MGLQYESGKKMKIAERYHQKFGNTLLMLLCLGHFSLVKGSVVSWIVQEQTLPWSRL
jgi:hypothetical protein